MSKGIVLRKYEPTNIHHMVDMNTGKMFCNEKITTSTRNIITHEKPVEIKLKFNHLGNPDSYTNYSGLHDYRFIKFRGINTAEGLMDAANNIDFNEYFFYIRKKSETKYSINSGHDNVSFEINNSTIIKTDEKVLTRNDIEQEVYILKGTLCISTESLICNECKSESLRFQEPANQILGEYFYDNENHFKLTTIHKEIAYTHTNDSIAWYRIYKDMIIYNKTTHRIYKISNHHMRGATYLKNKNKKSIKDITYSNTLFNNYNIHSSGMALLFASITNHTKKQFCELYNYTDSDLKSFERLHDDGSVLDYDIVRRCVLLKDAYNIKNTKLAYILLQVRNYDKTLSSRMKGKTEKEILNMLKLSKKTLANIRRNDITMTYILSYNYVNNKDYINKIINTQKHCNTFIIKKERKSCFIHQYRKHNTEERFLNQVLKYSHYIKDTSNMLEKIIKANPEYYVDYSQDIKKIHDVISKDLTKYREKNKRIAKNKDIEKMFKEFTSCGLTYQLAKDTNELIDVGSFMDICVGGYRERALKKSVFIVVGYNSDNEPETCIEMNKVINDDEINCKYKVSQVKKKHNWKASNEEINDLNKLFKDNNVFENSYGDLTLSQGDSKHKQPINGGMQVGFAV